MIQGNMKAKLILELTTGKVTKTSDIEIATTHSDPDEFKEIVADMVASGIWSLIDNSFKDLKRLLEKAEAEPPAKETAKAVPKTKTKGKVTNDGNKRKATQ